MTWVDEIVECLASADKIAGENGIDNLYYNEMFMELVMASKLEHKFEAHTQGGDAIEPDTGKPTEYKLINTRNKSGGGSYQFHWLSNAKMDELRKTENMYFGRRDGVELVEVLRLPSSVILPLIEEKATGTDSIHGHKSFAHSTIRKLGGEIVYAKDNLTKS
tara:strand:+ start:525 stop:1010 length:486 start_codon:yes stop_codon:yes gene_type:complete